MLQMVGFANETGASAEEVLSGNCFYYSNTTHKLEIIAWKQGDMSGGSRHIPFVFHSNIMEHHGMLLRASQKPVEQKIR